MFGASSELASVMEFGFSGVWERCQLPQLVRGSPAAKRFLVHFDAEKNYVAQ